MQQVVVTYNVHTKCNRCAYIPRYMKSDITIAFSNQYKLTLGENPPRTGHIVPRRQEICLYSLHGTALTGSNSLSQRVGHPRGQLLSY